MSKLFRDLERGLKDMKKHLGGEEVEGLTLSTVEVKPIKELNGQEFKKLRLKLGYSQGVLAAVVGVSKKTIEAWEAGTTLPSKPALRLMQLLMYDEIARLVIAEKRRA